MVLLEAEFMDLFDFLYGEEGCGVRHVMLQNMDWSSNHAVSSSLCSCTVGGRGLGLRGAGSKGERERGREMGRKDGRKQEGGSSSFCMYVCVQVSMFTLPYCCRPKQAMPSS